ncbi:MAG: restriction endonuclease [Actinomycetia bacterium]|nr:restriction endonuclease [Actinomycetes bacterium]
MTVAATILLVVIAVAIAAFAINAMRSASQTAQRNAGASPIPSKPMPIVSEFHVTGDTAAIVFSVPLGTSEPGEHLLDLLTASAVEYVRDKTRDGLPLDGVTHIDVSAMRGDVPERIGSVDLPEVGVLPEPNVTVLVEPTHDPIAAVSEVVADRSVATPSGDTSRLEPVHEIIDLSGPIEAHLRGMGVDPVAMSLEDLVLGLLRISGYDVHVGRQGFTISADHGRSAIYGLTRNGQSTVLVTLMHEEGSHPELSEKALSEFAVGVAQLNPDQAILVTDKYSPYSMYEMEKANKRLVFITRERLQAFVDSFGIR